MSKAAQRIHLILDFDGTLTTHDTLDPLAQIGYNAFPNTQSSWDSISKAYMSDYTAHASSYQPPAEQRRTVSEEVAWLHSLKPIERASAARVEAAGFLRKLDGPAIRLGAHKAVRNGDVAFRPGWGDLLKRVETSIISVNFSRYFVHQTLQGAAEMANEAVGRVAIYANEMTGVDRETATTIPGQAVEVRTCADKIGLFKELDASAQGGQTPLKIYVGDSPTDLECLLAADIGICIRDEPMRSGQQELGNICARLAVHVKNIDGYNHTEVHHDGNVPKDEGKVLWCAKDFVEINECIRQLLSGLGTSITKTL